MARRRPQQGKPDGNQNQIVNDLRKIGASVESLAKIGFGAPDIAVGFRGKNYLIELKDLSTSRGRLGLNEAQQKWHESWRGRVDVATCLNEVLLIIGAIRSMPEVEVVRFEKQ